MLPKLNHWRCDKYLKWVKKLPSAISGLPADDAHHMKGHGMGGGIPAPDWAAFPLTRAEHTIFHSTGWQTWEQQHGNQFEHVARTLGLAIDQGILTIK